MSDSTVPRVFWHEAPSASVLVACSTCECGGPGFLALGAVTRDPADHRRYVWLDLTDLGDGSPTGQERRDAEDAAEDLLDHVGVFEYVDAPVEWTDAVQHPGCMIDAHAGTLVDAALRGRTARILAGIKVAS